MRTSTLLGKVKSSLMCLFRERETPVKRPTEYQLLVAKKANELMTLMGDTSRSDEMINKLWNGMRGDLEKVAQCKLALPTRELNGWNWYFLYENPDRIDVKHPAICDVQSTLNLLLDFDSLEGYERFLTWSKALGEKIKP